MLLSAGGLIAYKQMDEPPPQAAAPVATIDPAESPRDALPPPPPPPPPEEQPSSVPSVDRSAQLGKAGPNPCAATECKGTATPILQTALSGRGGAGRRCYEKALLQNATLSGRMRLAVRVGPQGQVCNAKVVSDQVGDPGLSTCILGVFRASTLPAPAGGCVDVEVPLSFVTPK
jgi:hypothetical protein